MVAVYTWRTNMEEAAGMSFRISYRDALGVDRLVAVADAVEGAQMLVRGLAAEVPRAGGRLSVTEEPRLDFSMQVVHPPYFLDNPAALPVVYLDGGAGTSTDWQTAAIASLRSIPVVIAHSRGGASSTRQGEPDAEAKWRERHLLLADAAVFWFEADAHDTASLLESAAAWDYTPPLALGAAPQWQLRGQLYGVLRQLDVDAVVHDSRDATLAHAVTLAEEAYAVRPSSNLLLPGAAEGELSCAITQPIPGRSTSERISDVLVAAAHAATRSTETLLLTRLHVALDDLRRDDGDPVAWTELYDVAAALQSRH
ncbi:nucleoside 2-deoxyribosyltransferase domain-containing protein [Couchioplanes caeruleus]|uniref:nucleoside 2-deoxyribosyltransferase domain-containing protein n=1 Tax=Couchioplanes caeruleus TaxID=56438 RepID=UPI0020BFA06A|nr:nucleoside 2-deoxyribosyltransferase domain-containing protein [Couchioplanes caeruleus]UQU66845.1 nucleoside 2-deoxyribosyltransferase domain-containing protein [Couchioplanes caeruleus]